MILEVSVWVPGWFLVHIGDSGLVVPVQVLGWCSLPAFAGEALEVPSTDLYGGPEPNEAPGKQGSNGDSAKQQPLSPKKAHQASITGETFGGVGYQFTSGHLLHNYFHLDGPSKL